MYINEHSLSGMIKAEIRLVDAKVTTAVLREKVRRSEGSRSPATIGIVYART